MTICWMHQPLIVLPMRKAIRHLKQADAVMARLIEGIGPCRIRFLDPAFETLAKSIVYQQLSGKVASVIFERLKATANGRKLTPKAFLAVDTETLRGVGLSRQKIEYLRGLAQSSQSGEVNFRALQRMDDAEVLKVLTGIKGIGVWTVHMFLIFALRRPDVMPIGDLGIRAAVRKAYGMEAVPTPVEVGELAESWRPYRTLASWYLWRSLETDANL
ncbi:MAG: DNA-3-methyladenine glycosylase [Bryobacteraceae bacterium]